MPLWTDDGQLKQFAVYIMSNHSMTLYTGVTNDLRRRVSEHKSREVPGFTKKYHCDRLVYFELHDDIRFAIEREKTIKGWNRERKIALVKETNPEWRDLSADFLDVPR
ncbi:MAG: GIY-YIG nuclease family protein [Thermoanaerobaculia bacterium]